MAIAETTMLGADEEVTGTAAAAAASGPASVVQAESARKDAAEALRWRIALNAATVPTYLLLQETEHL